MAVPAYGSDQGFVWTAPSCAICGGEDPDPCSEACERVSLRAGRMRRIEGLREQSVRALTLAEQYAAKTGWSSPRTVAILDHVLLLERQVRELEALNERDAGGAS